MIEILKLLQTYHAEAYRDSQTPDQGRYLRSHSGSVRRLRCFQNGDSEQEDDIEDMTEAPDVPP